MSAREAKGGPPGRSFVAACVQLRSGMTAKHNVDDVARLAREAAEAGAAYVQTPEMTNLLVRSREDLFAAIMPEDVDPSLAAFQELARALKIWLHLGSLAIRLEGERAANRAFVIDPEGDVVARYDKIHMFDVDLPGGESWRESQTYRPGEDAVVVRTGGVALVPYYRPGDPAVADAIRGLAGRHSAVLLANHGPVVAGESLEGAVFATEELEETAKLYLLLRNLNPRMLTKAQVDDLVAHFGLTLPDMDEGHDHQH